MFDDEVIKKLCESVGQPEKYEECLSEKEKALNDSKNRGNASDDYKSASGDIYVALKKRLSLTQCGNSPDSFIRDTLSPLIAQDMNVYRRLEEEIFG